MERLYITDLRRTKRGRYSVYIEGEFACVLHEEVFASSSLCAGGYVEREELEELLQASGDKLAREKALSLLSARPYTARGLRRKLSEKLDEDSASSAVERMVELGLVDDLDYARRFAADCVNLKGYGHPRIVRELLGKGVDREIIDQVLEERGDDPRLQIKELLRRKYLHRMEDEKGSRRAVAALQRLGYRYGDIRAALLELEEE